MLVIIILVGMFTKSKNKAVPIRYWLLLLTVPVTTLGTLTVYQYYIDLLAPGEDINIYIIRCYDKIAVWIFFRFT